MSMEQARADHTHGQVLAAVQLERVRTQMGDVYRPVQVRTPARGTRS